jgi:hypothetical protein
VAYVAPVPAYYPPPVAYIAPVPAYYPPAVAYYRPAAVYIAPRAVVYAPTPPYGLRPRPVVVPARGWEHGRHGADTYVSYMPRR